MEIQKLQFPIGKYDANKDPDKAILAKWINDIETFPGKLEELAKNLPVSKLNWKYRPDGWKVKQVVHHCADSHLNSIIRFKLALTEETPTIRPYFEARWAELVDSQDDDIRGSLDVLKSVHAKWVLLLKSLTDEDLKREYIHPEHGKQFNLAETIGSYAWHCNHHFAHVELGLESKGKYN